MPENETLTPGNLAPSDTARILGAIGEDTKPRNDAGQFVSANPAPEQVEPAQDTPVEQADTAPEETQPSGENEEQVDTEAPPAIDPPASWAAEDHEIFLSLPPKAQQKIAERERQRDVELRRGQDEVAKEKSEAVRARDEYQKQLNEVVPALQNQLQSKWAKVNWTQLANDHPADYVRLKAEYDQDVTNFQIAQHERARVNEQSQVEQSKKYQSFVQEQEAELVKSIPSWKDEKVGRAELQEVHGYLAKQGIPKDVLGQLVDAKQIQIARKAMLYDRAQSRVAKPSTQAKPPQVQKPGTSDPERPVSQAKAQQWETLRRSGSPDAAAALIKNML